MDNNEPQWTKMDNNGQRWKTMDNNGQQSAVLHASLMPFFVHSTNKFSNTNVSKRNYLIKDDLRK